MKGLALMIGIMFVLFGMGFMWLSESGMDDEMVRKLSHVMIAIYGIFTGVYLIVVGTN